MNTDLYDDFKVIYSNQIDGCCRALIAFLIFDGEAPEAVVITLMETLAVTQTEAAALTTGENPDKLSEPASFNEALITANGRSSLAQMR